MSSPAPTSAEAAAWRDLRVAVVGRLASLTKRDLLGLLKQCGAQAVDDPEAAVDVLLVGEYDLPPPDLAERVERASAVAGRAVRVISETDFRHELLDESAASPQRLYTPAMLADLLGVPIAVVRRWHRRGLIRPAREVRRLPYFDFHEIATARNLANMLAAGASPEKIERQLTSLRRWLPGVDRPLAQLSVIVAGRDLLLRQGDGLLDPGGQYRFDFDAASSEASTVEFRSPADGAEAAPDPESPEDLASAAVRCEEQGRLAEAADWYRAALAAAGPNADYCFQLADILYRLGDVGAARERYFAAVEIDEDFVEARANVGCILAEQGRLDLAIAAFEGALRYHGEYPDVHYHLARVLDEAGRRAEAETHWRAFHDLVPESPWAESARKRLGIAAEPADDAAAV